MDRFMQTNLQAMAARDPRAQVAISNVVEPTIPIMLQWKLLRVCEGALVGGYCDPDLMGRIDPEAILGALAMAEAEHGKHDPADLASVIDWKALRYENEPIEDYRLRTTGEQGAQVLD